MTGENYVIKTNVDDLMMTVFFLVRKGYGSIKEILSWDTPEFLDVVEYESIINDIETYIADKAKKGGKQ